MAASPQIRPGIRWLGDATALSPNRSPDVRYYFNIKDGSTMLDEEGIELNDMNDVKDEAIKSSADMLKGLHADHFWSGEPWVLWVSDQPNGGGNTVLTLTFTSRLAG